MKLLPHHSPNTSYGRTAARYLWLQLRASVKLTQVRRREASAYSLFESARAYGREAIYWWRPAAITPEVWEAISKDLSMAGVKWSLFQRVHPAWEATEPLGQVGNQNFPVFGWLDLEAPGVEDALRFLIIVRSHLGPALMLHCTAPARACRRWREIGYGHEGCPFCPALESCPPLWPAEGNASNGSRNNSAAILGVAPQLSNR